MTDDEWAGHPDVPVSESELAALIREDYKSGTWARP